MAKKLAIHIGLCSVDADVYIEGGQKVPVKLPSAEKDALDLAAISEEMNYELICLLLGADATLEKVKKAFKESIEKLEAGDNLLLSFSGHGAQVKRTKSFKAEYEGTDEFWCLYDGVLQDDEMHCFLSKIPKGVFVHIISDSCHGGGMLRDDEEEIKPFDKLKPDNRREYYQGEIECEDREADILLWAAARPKEIAADGIFTQTLVQLWNEGHKGASYADFFDVLFDECPTGLRPHTEFWGENDLILHEKKTFHI